MCVYIHGCVKQKNIQNVAILNENNMELVSKRQILAKDYLKQVKQDNLFKNAKIIFNDPTIA